MPSKSLLNNLIINLGDALDYEVLTEVEASESAWVDIVWFDKRLSTRALSTAKPKMRHAPVLPIVGFEVERHTALNAKHVKGSVSNLNNLGASLGVIVVGAENLVALQKQPKYTEWEVHEVEEVLRERIYRWVYAEAQPQGRIIIMFEHEVNDWAVKLSGKNLDELHKDKEGAQS